MSHSIWDAEKPGMKPGWKVLEVSGVNADRVSKKKADGSGGERMWIVTFRVALPSDQAGKIDDVFMQEGKGAWFTAQRLLALGFEKGQDFSPFDLIGRRVVAYVEMREETYNGNTMEKPKIAGSPKGSDGKAIPGGFVGYWPESRPPAESGFANAGGVADDNSAPF